MYWPSKSTIIGTFAELTVFNIRMALVVGDVVVSGWEGLVTSGVAVVSVHTWLSHPSQPWGQNNSQGQSKTSTSKSQEFFMFGSPIKKDPSRKSLIKTWWTTVLIFTYGRCNPFQSENIPSNKTNHCYNPRCISACHFRSIQGKYYANRVRLRIIWLQQYGFDELTGSRETCQAWNIGQVNCPLATCPQFDIKPQWATFWILVS